MKNDIHDPRPEVTTVSGQVDLLNPTPGMIDTTEMLASLARKGRYTDLSNITVTVGQHLLLCEHLAHLAGVHDPLLRMHILLHDAHEAYTGDIARPLKRLIERETGGLMSRIEEGLDRAIFSVLGLPLDIVDRKHHHHEVVKRFDNLALAHEVHWFFPNAEQTWSDLPALPDDANEPFIRHLASWQPSQVMSIMTDRIIALQGTVYKGAGTGAPTTVH